MFENEFETEKELNADFIKSLLADEAHERAEEFQKIEEQKMEEFKQELLTKSEEFNREYSSRVFIALQHVELDFHEIRDAYFTAIKFPIYLSCDFPTRNLEDSLEMARMTEIVTGEKVDALYDETDDEYTPCRIQAEVEQIVMRHLIKNVLTV